MSSWIIYLVLAAFGIYISYNFAALSLFGVPHSLSQTFYEFKKRKPIQRFLFPIMMVSMGFLLLPAWLEISNGSNFMFTSFLATAGILFTGFAPAFNRSDMENMVHSVSAILAATFALLWIILVANLWWFIVVWFVIASLIAFLTGTYKKSLIYLLETVSFMSTFTSIKAHFII